MIKIRGKEGDVERLQGQVESPKWKVKKVRTDNKARNAVDGGGEGGADGGGSSGGGCDGGSIRLTERVS